MSYKRLYHATLSRNVQSIIELGLDPARATGKIKAVWLVDSRRLPWAIAHIAARHDVSVRDIWIATVHVDPASLQRWRWQGVYLCRFMVQIVDIYEAAAVLNSGPERKISRGG